ncbi:putative porin [Blattabacterium cuenoti]|uniref:putative porin n=1 Tax=Blattabacterium cuenoti TaxID=1653831 RepID=UPI00163B7733|nr:putative porin [Blattabacterium cuenoti]
MKIVIFPFLFFLFFFIVGISKGIPPIPITVDDSKKEVTELYYNPTFQDYQFWTEKSKQKKILDNSSLSIEKYYSHNFFRKDNFGFFFSNRRNNLFIPHNVKLMQFTPSKSLNNDELFCNQQIHFFNNVFFSPEEIRYFDVKTPTTEILYVKNSFQERGVGVLFTQSPNETTNYSVEYRNFHFGEPPNFSEKKLLLTTFIYQNKELKKKLWGHYLYQDFDDEKKSFIPFWNTTTDNKNFDFEKKNFFHKRIYISGSQKIFPFLSWIEKNKNQSLFFKNNIEYTQYVKDHLFFKEVFKNNITHHSHFKNECSLILKKEEKSNVEIGFIYDKIRDQIFSKDLYNNNYNGIAKKKDTSVNKISINTKVNYFINKVFEFYSNGKWMIEDHNQNFLQTNVQLNTLLFSKFNFLTFLKFTKKNNIFSDFFNFSLIQKNGGCNNNYHNNTKNEFYTKSIGFFFFPKEKENLDIFFKVSKINFDSKEKIPNLLDWKYINSCELKIRTIHDIWKFQFNNVFLYQKYNSDQFIFSIPNFLFRNTISYKDHYFNQSLFIQTGLSIHYFSKFDYKYFSYPSDFFSESENECSPYYSSKKGIKRFPFIDYFFNFKVFRIQIYTRIQNIQNIIFHQSKKEEKENLSIKIGLLWNLFT